MTLFAFEDKRPVLASDAWVAPDASVIGDVRLDAGASVWFGAVIRGDNEPIHVGRASNVQDLAVLHTDPGFPLQIGEDVSIGHRAMLHGCVIGDGCLIGMGATIMNGAVIGEDCLVAANALITERKIFEPRSLIVGSPARVVRPLTDEETARLRQNAQLYLDKARRFRDGLRVMAADA